MTAPDDAVMARVWVARLRSGKGRRVGQTAAMTDIETLAWGYGLVEGPRVDDDGSLYFSDVHHGGVRRLGPDGTIDTVVPKRRGVGGIALHADGGLVISGRNICHVRDGETRVVFAPDAPGLNDLFVDTAGRVICGTMRSDPFSMDGPRTMGECWRIDADGAATELYGGVSLTNGIGLSPDGSQLYHADTTQGVWVHDYDDGRVSNRRLLGHPADLQPDGLAVDEAGTVWVADVSGSGAVRGFSPDGAEVGTRAGAGAHGDECLLRWSRSSRHVRRHRRQHARRRSRRHHLPHQGRRARLCGRTCSRVIQSNRPSCSRCSVGAPSTAARSRSTMATKRHSPSPAGSASRWVTTQRPAASGSSTSENAVSRASVGVDARSRRTRPSTAAIAAAMLLLVPPAALGQRGVRPCRQQLDPTERGGAHGGAPRGRRPGRADGRRVGREVLVHRLAGQQRPLVEQGGVGGADQRAEPVDHVLELRGVGVVGQRCGRGCARHR